MPVFGDKIPPNKRQVLEDTLMMLEAVPPLISVQTAHRNLTKVGYDFDEDEIKLIAADAKLRAAAQTAAATATDPQARIQQQIAQKCQRQRRSQRRRSTGRGVDHLLQQRLLNRYFSGAISSRRSG
jgi:hypothetical protein